MNPFKVTMLILALTINALAVYYVDRRSLVQRKPFTVAYFLTILAMLFYGVCMLFIEEAGCVGVQQCNDTVMIFYEITNAFTAFFQSITYIIQLRSLLTFNKTLKKICILLYFFPVLAWLGIAAGILRVVGIMTFEEEGFYSSMGWYNFLLAEYCLIFAIFSILHSQQLEHPSRYHASYSAELNRMSVAIGLCIVAYIACAMLYMIDLEDMYSTVLNFPFAVSLHFLMGMLNDTISRSVKKEEAKS